MKNINVKTSNYNIYNQKSWCLITSLLWAGFGFAIVALLSWLYSYLIINYAFEFLYSDNYLITSSILLFVFISLLLFFQYKWDENIINSSFFTIFINWILNIIFFAGIIAPFITLIDNPQLVYAIIGITGIIFLIIGFLGYFIIKRNTAIGMTKLISILVSIIFVMQLIFIFPFAFLYTNAISIYYLIYDIAFAIISVLLIAITFWQISKSKDYYDNLNKSQQIKLSLYFGLKLLNCFILLLIVIIRLFAFNKE